jgi:hypothetical protein
MYFGIYQTRLSEIVLYTDPERWLIRLEGKRMFVSVKGAELLNELLHPDDV